MTGRGIDYWASEEGAMLLSSWRRDGYLMSDIATKMGITPKTLCEWQSRNETIANALRTAKEIVDYEVENALLKAALGYKAKEVKLTMGKVKRNGDMYEVLKEVTTREVGPNPRACIMWLNNRKPDVWKWNRDKTEEAKEDNNFTITIERGPGAESDDDGINNKVTVSSKCDGESKKEETENDLDYWPEDFDENDIWDDVG